MIKKTYRISGFDCASCAQNAEKHLNKHPSIDTAVLDFAGDLLHVTYIEEELTISEIIDIIHEVEEDEIVVSELSNKKQNKIFTKDLLITLIRIVVTIILLLVARLAFNDQSQFWIAFTIYLVGLLVIGYDVYWNVIKNIVHLENPIDEHLLIAMASTGAFVVAAIMHDSTDFVESLLVVILFQIGEIVEGIATNKSKAAISSAVELRVEKANLIKDNGVFEISPEDVKIGDELLVTTGELVPVDSVIIEGNALLDTSSLTGEFMPISAKENMEIYSGFLVKEGSIKVKAIREYQSSAVAKVVDLITKSGANKSKADQFVTRFARWYTPVIFGISLLTGLIGGLITNDWNTWVILGLKMLVVGCPCAIVISIPLVYFSSVGLASKNGIVVKGTNYFDKLVELDTLYTDKTGTLTKGEFAITKIEVLKGTKEEFLKYLYAAESLSNHPIAKAICRSIKNENNGDSVANFAEIAGFGVSATYKNKTLLAGNKKLLDKYNISSPELDEAGTITYLAYDEELLGYVILNDEIKEDAKEMVELLNGENVNVVLLTGDKKESASRVCRELGINDFHSDLLPENKVEYVEQSIKEKHVVGFLGDGINDAPCIRGADVGIAMGGVGSDIAVENADIVIMSDRPSKVYDAIKISKIARNTAIFNIIFALSIKMGVEIAAIITSLLGRGELIPMWLAVVADTGLTVILVINSLLVLYRKIKHKVVK